MYARNWLPPVYKLWWTPAGKSLYRSIILDDNILHCLLWVLSFYTPEQLLHDISSYFRLALKATVLFSVLSYRTLPHVYSQKICGYHTNSWSILETWAKWWQIFAQSCSPFWHLRSPCWSGWMVRARWWWGGSAHDPALVRHDGLGLSGPTLLHHKEKNLWKSDMFHKGLNQEYFNSRYIYVKFKKKNIQWSLSKMAILLILLVNLNCTFGEMMALENFKWLNVALLYLNT